jgi:hypothetical protein
MRAVQFLLDLLTPAEVGEVISKTKRKSLHKLQRNILAIITIYPTN